MKGMPPTNTLRSVPWEVAPITLFKRSSASLPFCRHESHYAINATKTLTLQQAASQSLKATCLRASAVMQKHAHQLSPSLICTDFLF